MPWTATKAGRNADKSRTGAGRERDRRRTEDGQEPSAGQYDASYLLHDYPQGMREWEVASECDASGITQSVACSISRTTYPW